MPTPSSTPSLVQGLVLFLEIYVFALSVMFLGLVLAVLGTRSKTRDTTDTTAIIQ
jgi:hypothetical protein